MPGTGHTPSFPRLPLVFALLGLLWCIYMSLPSGIAAPCATSGCALFRDSKIAGISLWWAGGFFFLLLAALCVLGRKTLAWRLLQLGIFLDAILLIVMFFTAPCFDCLVVAACMGLALFCITWGGARQKSDNTGQQRFTLPALLPIWFGLFIANSVLAANEMLPHYVMGNTDATQVRLYFSPSCPACRDAVVSLKSTASLYPVEEKEGDFEAILRFESYLKDDSLSYKEKLDKSLNPDNPVPQLSLLRHLELRIQLLRNKAAVMRQGFRALPLIQINGMPQLRSPVRILDQALPTGNAKEKNSRPAGAPTPIEERNGLPDFLEGVGDLGQCPQDSEVPCD